MCRGPGPREFSYTDKQKKKKNLGGGPWIRHCIHPPQGHGLQWGIQGGGGGSRGSGPPLLGHDVGFLTLGSKLDPPPFLLV